MALFAVPGSAEYFLCQSLEKIPYEGIGAMGEAVAQEIQVRAPVSQGMPVPAAVEVVIVCSLRIQAFWLPESSVGLMSCRIQIHRPM